MPDYQKGKIYKLIGYGKTYYGSTTQLLCQRKTGHKRSYKNHRDCKSKEIFELGDDVDIVLVESYPCNNKEELHKRERYYIENFECVNKIIPTRTIKEWREDNKDKIKQYYEDNKDKNKIYRENNKEHKKEYDKNIRNNDKERHKKIICDCGGSYVKRHKMTHLKTKKHLKYL